MTDPAIKSAKRVFEILEHFDRERRPLALKEITAKFGYPPSSGSLLLKSLVTLGYLEYDQPSRTYFPTMRIAALGSWVQGSLFGEGEITRLMEHLHKKTKETVILATRSGLYAQYVHVVHSGQPLHFGVPPGTRRPLANSGMGWLFLSTLGPKELDRVRRRINAEPLRRQKLSADDILRRIAQVRAKGYAFSKGSVSEGVGIVGMLLPKGALGRRFAIGVAGPIGRLERREKAIVDDLRSAIARYL